MKKMYLEKENCICYNASRQKNEARYSKQYDSKKPRCWNTGAFLFPILAMAGLGAIG